MLSTPDRNVLSRQRLSPAIILWSYAIVEPSPIIPIHPLGLEIAVTLGGERYSMHEDGDHCATRGTVTLFNIGERYTTCYRPSLDGGGREIGFVVLPDEAATASDEVVVFPRRSCVDPRMTEVCEGVRRALDMRMPMPTEAVASEVRELLGRHGELRRLDPLGRARLAIHRESDKALYMRHFAEVAGVHVATFARTFRERYGETPARYRMQLRLSQAALLVALRPDMTVRDIAAKVGFEDVPYFHRAFGRMFGTTPLTFGRKLNGAYRAPILQTA